MPTYKVQPCRTPWCKNSISIKVNNINRKMMYCTKCKRLHTKSILELQYFHEKPIKDILLFESKLFNFKSLSMISDALETNISSLRSWIKKYFDMDWDTFRQTYDCKHMDCLVFNMSNVSNKYYLQKQIKKERICSCLSKDNRLFIRPKTKNDEEYVKYLVKKQRI